MFFMVSILSLTEDSLRRLQEIHEGIHRLREINAQKNHQPHHLPPAAPLEVSEL